MYHVACNHELASDNGSGSEAAPFKTIHRAAQTLEPGQKVIIHGGVYRESVRPARGGTGPDAMIAYEAAPDETVVITGSELLTGPFVEGSGWRFSQHGQPEPDVWAADIQSQWVAGYNPFALRNITSEYTSFTPDWTPEETNRLLLRRGMLFCDGKPLRQVLKSAKLGDEDGRFWVEDSGNRLYFRLPGDTKPGNVVLEAAVREQAFAPDTPGLGYIRISGISIRYSADPFPIPQKAALSTGRGHHWIIEDCDITYANAVGLDIGGESWHRKVLNEQSDMGHHIARRNKIGNCGICGIAGVGNVSHSLIENNIVENVAAVDIERLWETAGIKLHTCTGVLLRRNIIRHIRSATAVWLDFLIENTRMTENLVYDVKSLHGGLMIEVSDTPNLVDRNILWDIRGVPDIWHSTSGVSGPAINMDTNEACIIVHNFIGNVLDEYAISMHLAQPDRVVIDRFLLCRKHEVLNNLVVGCPKRVLLSRAEDNRCDGNLYDLRDDFVSLCVEYPGPAARVNLESWRRNFGYDVNGGQARIDAAFDSKSLSLTIDIEGVIQTAVDVDNMPDAPKNAGPWNLKPGRQIIQIDAGC